MSDYDLGYREGLYKAIEILRLAGDAQTTVGWLIDQIERELARRALKDAEANAS